MDGHCDTVRRFISTEGEYDFTRRNRAGHIDLPRLRDGGVKIQFFALYLEPPEALQRCLQLIDGYYSTMLRCAKELQTIYTVADLKEVMQVNKIGVLLTVEGGEVLKGDLSVLHLLFKHGIRSLGLTWNRQNQLATGVGEGINGKGLTSFGRMVVRELNALGMIVDLAHINEKGFYDAISLSSTPIIVSHANARALCNHPRNLSDKQLRLVKENGGVVGMSFYPPFVHRKSPSLNKLLDHFVHVAEVAGVEHLGLGSDFDGIDQTVEGLDDVSCMPRLIEGLSARGFSPKEMEQIASRNYLRVIEKVLPKQ